MLLIGDAVPSPRRATKHFFYAEPLTAGDTLFRAVVEALYAQKAGRSDQKEPWLRRLKEDAVYVLDVVPQPSRSQSPEERRRSLEEHATDFIDQVRGLAPAGVIIWHPLAFDVVADPLRGAGIPVLHDDPIPPPVGATRRRFLEELRHAIRGSISRPAVDWQI